MQFNCNVPNENVDTFWKKVNTFSNHIGVDSTETTYIKMQSVKWVFYFLILLSLLLL